MSGYHREDGSAWHHDKQERATAEVGAQIPRDISDDFSNMDHGYAQHNHSGNANQQYPNSPAISPYPVVETYARGSMQPYDSLPQDFGQMGFGGAHVVGHAGGNEYQSSPVEPGSLIRTRDEGQTYETADTRFRTQPSSEFYFGRILRMMWSEPRGENGTLITSFDNNGLTKMRRFVVINTYQGHSICLSIVTYGGRGTTKNGCHPRDHAAIYSGDKPEFVRGEKKDKLKKSIKCRMNSKDHKLDPISRLNYTKLYTVEHNVKIQFIGRVSTSSESWLRADYDAAHRPLSTFQPATSHFENEAFTYDPGFINQQPQFTPMTTGQSSGSHDADYNASGSSYYDQNQDPYYYDDRR